MAPRNLSGRLDRLHRRLSLGLLEDLETERAEQQAAESIRAGTATSADFEAWVGSHMDDRRTALIEAAAQRRHSQLTFGPMPMLPEADRIAACIIAAQDDDDPAIDVLYEWLEELASEPPSTDLPRFLEYSLHKPLGFWVQANLALVLLGEDRGRALRAAAREAITEVEPKHDECTEGLRREIEAGTADWVAFMIWFQPQHDLDQIELGARAALYRFSRAFGKNHHLPVTNLQDHAASYLSYPPDQDPPAVHRTTLEQALALHAPIDHPNHRTWVSAWRWRHAMGGGWGRSFRPKLAENFTVYLDVGLRFFPPPDNGGQVRPTIVTQ